MKKQILSEEFKRMQKIAGVINENEYPYELGKPHPFSVYPAGEAYQTLSTGKSIDIGEHPYHNQYPNLSKEEHEEIIKLLNNYIEQYIKKFQNTKYYQQGTVNLAKYLVKQHQQKLAGVLKENEASDLTDKEKLYLESKLEEFLNKSLFSSKIMDRDEGDFEPSLEEQAIQFMIKSLQDRISYYQ